MKIALIIGSLILIAAGYAYLIYQYLWQKNFVQCLKRLMTQQEEDPGIEKYLRKCTLEDRKLFLSISEKINAENYSKNLKIEAELHALQNQINPHFLYNTLEVIRGRALVQNAQDIADMTEALATIFRYNINRPGEVATFQEEQAWYGDKRHNRSSHSKTADSKSKVFTDRIQECRIAVRINSHIYSRQ